MREQDFMCRTVDSDDDWWETEASTPPSAARAHALECWETAEIDAADPDDDDVPIGDRVDMVVAVQGHGEFLVRWDGNTASVEAVE